jgi:hypothetical protein
MMDSSWFFRSDTRTGNRKPQKRRLFIQSDSEGPAIFSDFLSDR